MSRGWMVWLAMIEKVMEKEERLSDLFFAERPWLEEEDQPHILIDLSEEKDGIREEII